MYKQCPSRNNRSKGHSKAKLILQICLLLAVCFWLIYQAKRSHDKKVEFDPEDEKVVGKVQSVSEILRFGTKDLPRVTKTATDADEHLLEEMEESKHEDDEQDREDDVIDENDHEDEINKGDDVEEEEHSETEEHDGRTNEDHGEAEEGEDGSNEDHDEGDVKLEERDHDGDGANTHEAREELYRAHDASSEVGHDNQTLMPETGNATVEHTNEIWSDVEQENGSIASNKEDEVNSNITSTNATVTEFEDPVNDSVMSEDGTIKGGIGYENLNLKLTMVGNISEHVNTSELATDDENHLQSATDSNNSENVNTNAVESLISDDTNTMLVDGQKLEESGTFESEENVNVIPHDPIDASDSTLTQDEKDSRMDLDTLPEITTEAQNTDDTMVE